MNKSEAGKLGALAAATTITKLRQSRMDAYNANPNLCKKCSSVIDYDRKNAKFCSNSCSVAFSNAKRPKRKSNYIANCKNCDKTFTGKKHSLNTFCSNKCKLELLSKEREERLKLGTLSSRVTKAILIKQYGHKCMECGWDKINPTSNKCPVELEHIDGNSQNNSPDNVKLLCPNCHSLTPTYKALNMGKGRHTRRQRYQDGKSH